MSTIGERFREQVGDRIPRRALDVYAEALDNGWLFDRSRGGLASSHDGGTHAIMVRDGEAVFLAFKASGAFDGAVIKRGPATKTKLLEHLRTPRPVGAQG
jgi:hypothetical protein